jgi:hypothetical protein
MNEWSCNSSPPICLHVVYRDNFYHLPYLILNNYIITLNMKVFFYGVDIELIVSSKMTTSCEFEVVQVFIWV